MHSLSAHHHLTPEQVLALFAQLPIPLSVYDAQGKTVGYNAAHGTMFTLPPDFLDQGFNLLTDPQLAAIGIVDLHRQVMAGATVVLPPHFVEVHDGVLDVARWTEATYFPLRGADGMVTHMVAMLRDVTELMQQQQQISEVQHAIAAAQEHLSTQQQTLEQLSTPVIQVWDGILALPLIGTIDSRRALQITDSLLSAISDRQADCVIIDITGIPMVDTQVAAYLLQATQASMLLGCAVCVVGISAEIAQTLVQLDVDFRSMITLANLQAGIAWAFARRGLTVG